MFKLQLHVADELDKRRVGTVVRETCGDLCAENGSLKRAYQERREFIENNSIVT